MRKLLLLAIIVLATSAFTDQEIRGEFQKFVRKYHKKYSSLKEYTKRLHIFTSNIKRLEKKNHATQGITKFMDLTPNEFKAKYLTSDYKRADKKVKKPIKFQRRVNAPDEYNWVTEGGVNPPKDPGDCDAGYALACTSQMEGAAFAKHKDQFQLSAQVILDCDVSNN